MDSKKRVAVVMLVLIISIIGISIVSAGWWSDLIGKGEEREDLEGELAESFEATVGLANAPPQVITYLPVDDRKQDNTEAGGSLGQVQPQAGTVVYAVVSFVAEDLDGADDLPDTAELLIGDTAAANEIEIDLVSPTGAPVGSGVTRSAQVGVDPDGVSDTCFATSCVANPDCPDQTAGTDQKQYTCYVQMQFYDAPVANSPPLVAADAWIINVRIEDNTGNEDPASSTDWSFDADNYVWYRTISEIDVTPGESLVWTGLVVTATDTIGDDNVVGGDTGVTLRNRGNTAVNDVDLIPQDLTGTGTAVLKSESMSIGLTEGGVNSEACDAPGEGGPGTGGLKLPGGTTLQDFPTAGNLIGYSAGGSDTGNMFFCVWARVDSQTACSGPCLTGESSLTYSATGGTSPYGQGEYWEVVFNS